MDSVLRKTQSIIFTALDVMFCFLLYFQATKLAATTAQKTKELGHTVNEKVSNQFGLYIVILILKEIPRVCLYSGYF